MRVAPSGLDFSAQAWGDPDPGGCGGSRATPEKGCIPNTNCCVIVPQDKLYSVERFGKFQRILSPGLSCVGCDLFGICLGFRSISSRINQSLSMVITKTKDNVFVTLKVATQHSVCIDGAAAAMYKLSDRDAQIDSYVNDVVRSQVPQLSLDEAFEQRDMISREIQVRLQKEMAFYGFLIHKVLIVDVTPDTEVVQSMNEINKQRRLRDATEMASEAEKIRKVKAAEAAADAQHLEGQGIARQRRAILQGLEDALVQGGDEALPLAAVKELLLTTQYHETMRTVASECKAQSVFVPHSAGHLYEVAARVRHSIQASSAPGQVRM